MKDIEMFRQTLIMLSALVVAACLYADIGPRPKYVHRLHRIGYEVLQENSSSQGNEVASAEHRTTVSPSAAEVVSSASLDWTSIGEILLLASLIVGSVFIWRRSWKGKCAVIAFWLLLLVIWIIRIGREIRDQFNVAMMSVPSVREIREDGPGWKFEDQVSESEKTQLMARVAEVKEFLQNAVNDSGITVRTAQHWQEQSAARADRIRAITEILSQNADLRNRCKGIPIEYLEDQLVFGLYANARWRFENWATQKSKNLSSSENKVLFRWQLFVANKERRNWKGVFSKNARFDRLSDDLGFSDFIDDSKDGSSFVRNWFERARTLGYEPDDTDRMLLKRAERVRPKLSDKIILSGTSLSIRGALSESELTALKECTENTLGRYLDVMNGSSAVRGETQTRSLGRMTVDLSDSNEPTLAAVCKILGERIGSVKISMTGKSNGVDLSPLAELKDLRGLKLRGCLVVKSKSLKKTSLDHFVAENCSLGNMIFLDHVADLFSIRIENSDFNTTENLRWAIKYCGEIDVRDAKSLVDLSFVRDMNGYAHGYTFDSGRRIPSFIGGLEKLDVSGSHVSNIAVLANCRRLRKVTYTSVDVSQDDIEFLQKLSARSDREIEVHDATKERVDRLMRTMDRQPTLECMEQVLKCGGDVNALWHQYWSKHGRKADRHIVEELLDKGADVNEQMRFGTALGQLAGNRDADGATNRIAVMTLLLDKGANPNIVTRHGQTVLADVLSWTSVSGRLDLVKLLLEKGVDPNGSDRMGKTAIEELFQSGLDDERLALARLLMAHGADVNETELLGSMRRWEFSGDKIGLVRELVEKGVVVNDMAIGAAWPDIEIRRYLIQKAGTKESDYEVTDRPGGFSIHRGGIWGRHEMDNNQRMSVEEHLGRMEKSEHEMEAHHQGLIDRMRRLREMERSHENRDRRRREEECLLNVYRSLERLESQRKELIRILPIQKKDAYQKWFTERRTEETNRLETIQRECEEMVARGHRLTEECYEKEIARENEFRKERRKSEDRHIMDMRDLGVPDHIIREHELMIKRREGEERRFREMDEVRGVRSRSFESGSDLPSRTSEYVRWLRRRHEEEEHRVHGECSDRPTMNSVMGF